MIYLFHLWRISALVTEIVTPPNSGLYNPIWVPIWVVKILNNLHKTHIIIMTRIDFMSINLLVKLSSTTDQSQKVGMLASTTWISSPFHLHMFRLIKSSRNRHNYLGTAHLEIIEHLKKTFKTWKCQRIVFGNIFIAFDRFCCEAQKSYWLIWRVKWES